MINTKKAIEFLKVYRTYVCLAGNIDDIISLLKQDEANSKELKIVKEELKKVWQMWGECKKDIARASVLNWKVSAERFLLEMRKLEQKYFPKEAK